MIDFLKKQLFTVHQNGKHQVSEVFKFIGPGIIVTVGFIDPGNWAANLAAGASYGYDLSLALQQVLSLLSHCSLRALPLLLQQVWLERVFLQACLVSLTI